MTDLQTITALEKLTSDADSAQNLLRAFRLFVSSECPVKGECEDFTACATVFADRMDAFNEVLFKAYELLADVYEQACTLLTQIESERSDTQMTESERQATIEHIVQKLERLEQIRKEKAERAENKPETE